MSITLPSPAFPQGHSSPCFSWCDHGDQFPGEHESSTVSLSFPRVPGLNAPVGPVLSVSLYQSDEAPVTRVSIDVHDEEGEPAAGACIDPSAAVEFADRLIAFAWRVREQAALASRPPLPA